MTANQLKAQENELKREEIAEKKRTGKAERFNKYAKGAGDFIKGASSLIGAVNDPSWYNQDKALVNDVAQLPYGQPVGIGVQQNGMQMNASGTVYNTPTDNHIDRAALPGVMRLEFAPTVGDGSGQDSDAINVAMRNVYSFVRHANSGSRNYDAPDMMQYFVTMSSIYTLIQHCARAYSIALTAKSENRYYPATLLKAAGFSTGTGSILNNLSQFRAEINMAIQKASIFNVPGKFPYFNRHMWLASNIFKDGAYKRSRLYVFVPSMYYPSPDTNGRQQAIRYFGPVTDFKFTTTSNWYDPSGTIAYNDVRSLTFEGAVALLRHLIDNATQNEDYGIMSGDILKAFGDSGVFKLQQIGEDYHVPSTYSPEVLTQIQGAVCMPGSYEGAFIGQTVNGILYQGTDRIFGGNHTPTASIGIYGYNPTTSGTGTPANNLTTVPDCKRVLINMYKDEVTPDDNMVATRLSNIYSYVGHGYYTINVAGTNTNYGFTEVKAETCASELIDGIVLFALPGGIDNVSSASDMNGVAALFYNGLKFNLFRKSSWNGALAYSALLYLVRIINSFEWAPRICIANTDFGTNVCISIYENQEHANYIYINKEIIQKLHAVALLSLFAVPLLGNTVRKY